MVLTRQLLQALKRVITTANSDSDLPDLWVVSLGTRDDVAFKERCEAVVNRRVLVVILFIVDEKDLLSRNREDVIVLEVLLVSNATTKQNGTTFMEVIKNLTNSSYTNSQKKKVTIKTSTKRTKWMIFIS